MQLTLLQAAIRFHRIDANRDGYITCEEAYDWSEESFLGKLFDPTKIEHPFGTSDASSACKILKNRLQVGQEWPDLLKDNLNPLNEIVKDGRIEPEEFDRELEKLTKEKREHLMKEVLKHPLMYSRV